MDKREVTGFFPERKVLGARQLRALVDRPEDPSKARTQVVATWVSVSVAFLTPVLANAVVFGWMPLRLSLEIVLCAATFILVVAGVLAALKVRRALLAD